MIRFPLSYFLIISILYIEYRMISPACSGESYPNDHGSYP